MLQILSTSRRSSSASTGESVHCGTLLTLSWVHETWPQSHEGVQETRNKLERTLTLAVRYVSTPFLLRQPLPRTCIYIGVGQIIGSTMGTSNADALVYIGCVVLHRLPFIEKNGPSSQTKLLFGVQDPSPSTTELDKPPGKEQSRSLRGHRSREDLPADNTLEGTPANKRRRGTRATENGTAPIGHAGDFCEALNTFWSHPEQGSPLLEPCAIRWLPCTMSSYI